MPPSMVSQQSIPGTYHTAWQHFHSLGMAHTSTRWHKAVRAFGSAELFVEMTGLKAAEGNLI